MEPYGKNGGRKRVSCAEMASAGPPETHPIPGESVEAKVDDDSEKEQFYMVGLK